MISTETAGSVEHSEVVGTAQSPERTSAGCSLWSGGDLVAGLLVVELPLVAMLVRIALDRPAVFLWGDQAVIDLENLPIPIPGGG